MTSYDLMINANHSMIKGESLSSGQIDAMVGQFLAEKSTSKQAQRYYSGMEFPNNSDNGGRRMYPIFFIPPYNDGKKLKTVLGQTPKTQILSANMYELEILRLLHLFAPEDKEVAAMIAGTLDRLKATCFGYMDDGVGECFDASLVVLRFLAAAAQQETEWIKSRIDNYKRHYRDKKRPWFSRWYYWLCLSELPSDIADPEIEKCKDEMLDCVKKINRLHPVCHSILCNILSKYPGYEYLQNQRMYVDEKDGKG